MSYSTNLPANASNITWLAATVSSALARVDQKLPAPAIIPTKQPCLLMHTTAGGSSLRHRSINGLASLVVLLSSRRAPHLQVVWPAAGQLGSGQMVHSGLQLGACTGKQAWST